MIMMTVKSLRVITKKLIVLGLEYLCSASHFVPILRNHTNCKLATKSDELDQRWETNVWKKKSTEN